MTCFLLVGGSISYPPVTHRRPRPMMGAGRGFSKDICTADPRLPVAGVR